MSSQKGFAHAFLIIGLVVALIGALGFVFWQNFIYEESVAKTELITTTKNNQDVPNKQTSASIDDHKITLTYPDNWSDSSISPATDLVNARKLASPDNNVEIFYSVNKPEVFGATCAEDVTLDSLKINSVADSSDNLKFVSSIASSESGPNYYFGVLNSQTVLDTNVGDKVCKFNPIASISSKPFLYISVYATFSKLENNSKLTQQQIEDTLQSSDAEVAGQIISSLSLE